MRFKIPIIILFYITLHHLLILPLSAQNYVKSHEDYNKVMEMPSVEIFKENGLLGIKDNS